MANLVRSIKKRIVPKSLRKPNPHQVELLARPASLRYDGERAGILDCCVAYNQYGGYCVPLSVLDRPAVQRVLEGNVYEPDTIAFMCKQCSGGDIIHAGTFFGDFLPALSHAVDDGAVIWAFEPNPESFRCAKATLEINGIENVRVTNTGLGNQETTLYFKTTDSHGVSEGGHSRFVDPASSPPVGCIEAQTVRIDDCLPANRNVSMIQLDVEGFEEYALLGAVETIKRCRPILILESHPSESWFEENLDGVQYMPLCELHENTVFVAKGI